MPKLEWLAVVQLADGKLHTYRQPSEDPAEGFKEVLEYEKKGELISFFLDDPERKKALGVNLKTGRFIISFIFFHHPAPEVYTQNTLKNGEVQEVHPVYRLINYRRMRKDYGQGIMGTDKEGRTWVKGQWLASYILGWQTTIDDKNIQRMMFIDANTLEVTFKEKR